jgi:hypothetical protein
MQKTHALMDNAVLTAYPKMQELCSVSDCEVTSNLPGHVVSYCKRRPDCAAESFKISG